MPLSSAGIGSNLDVNTIISGLMSIERRPLTLLDKGEAALQGKISAYGNIKSALAAFRTAAASLNDLTRFSSYKSTVADTSVLSVTASTSASPGTYTVDVQKLAQAQKLVTSGVTDITASIGTGTLTIDLGTISGGSFSSITGKYTGATFTSSGGGTKTVTIGSGDSSLEGIRKAINAAGVGVTASIVNDGGATPYHLVLASSTTGSANSIKISVSGDAAVQNLLAHDSSATQNLTETQTAQNALVAIDGVSISKATNVFSDAVADVTFSLLKESGGTPTKVTIERDTALVKASVESFVKAYNALQGTLADLSAYNATTKQGAILQGDTTLLSIQRQVRSVVSKTLAGVSGSYNTLSPLGVTFQTGGTLDFNATKLDAALSTNYQDIAAVFAAVGTPTDSLVKYTGSSTSSKPGQYALSISQLATKGTDVGSAAAALTITTGVNDTLQVTLDGVSSTVTLTAGTYASATALAAEIRSKINGVSTFSSNGSSVTVNESAGVLSLTSARYGSASVINITGGNGKLDILGSDPTVTTGLDVAGSIGDSAAVGSGQTLTGGTGTNAAGIKLQITGGALGSRGTVNFSQGYAYQLSNLADAYLKSDGILASRTDGLNDSVESIGKQRDVINQRLGDVEARLRAQYSALDVLISGMKSTQSFLAAQFDKLPK